MASYPLRTCEDVRETLLAGRESAPLAVRDEDTYARCRLLGRSQVALLAGGAGGWIRAGGEVFRDVDVPGNALGERVESNRRTPSLSADVLVCRGRRREADRQAARFRWRRRSLGDHRAAGRRRRGQGASPRSSNATAPTASSSPDAVVLRGDLSFYGECENQHG